MESTEPNYPTEPQQQPQQPEKIIIHGDANLESAGLGDAEYAFSEQSVRMAFIRKVYGTLMIQLLVTVAIIALFVYEPSVRQYSQETPEIWLIGFLLTIGLIVALSSYKDFRRIWPINIILLGLFTICEGIMLGAVSSLYESDGVLIAIGICTIVCFALTIFAMQTKWDFTAYGGILFVFLVILVVFTLIAIIIPNDTTLLVNAAIGALLFSGYLVYDTQLMLGGKHKYAISPEEYVFAALNLYLDVINLFLYIWSLIRRWRK